MNRLLAFLCGVLLLPWIVGARPRREFFPRPNRPVQIRRADLQPNQDLIAGLRSLADYLESEPLWGRDAGLTLNLYYDDEGEFKAAFPQVGGMLTETDDFTTLTRSFGPKVTLSINHRRQ